MLTIAGPGSRVCFRDAFATLYRNLDVDAQRVQF